MDTKTLKQLEELMQQLLNKAMINVATKDDLKSFASKEDLESFATKDDIKSLATKDDLKGFASKEDLNKLEKRLEGKFATKDDLIAMEGRLTKEIRDTEISIIASVDRNKAEKSDVEDLQHRIIKIERKLAT